MSIINATKLSALFKNNAKLGQGVFPELIKKLIIASVNCGSIRFPSGDAIYAPGFDGIIKDISESSGVVPIGYSVWELGTDSNSKKKADADFATRTNKRTQYDKSGYTFVFCTPHIWNGDILDWETEKKSQDIWKDVKLIDGAIIADWVNANIEIAVWLLNKFEENKIDGITNLELEIKRVCELTYPNLTCEILTCSNEDKSKEFVSSLSNINQRYCVVKPTINFEQGYFFVLGALQLNNDEQLNSKVIIVNDKESLSIVNKHCKDKIVIVNFVDANEDFNGPNRYVFVTVERIQTATLELNPIFFEDFSKALEGMGFSVSETHEITAKTNRNISCLKRRYAVNKMIKKPKWANDTNKNDIIPIALLSEINLEIEVDREVVSKLITGDVDAYWQRLNDWLNKEDTPLFKDGAWYRIYSKEEALLVLGLDYDSPAVKTLEAICKEMIFVTPDSKYKKDRSEWHINDGSNKFPVRRIKGILDSFAILSNNKNSQTHYDKFVLELLSLIKQSEALLNTFICNFALLSEISAKATIDFVNDALDNDDASIQYLLPEYGIGIISKSSNFIYLYWAIKECLYREKYAMDAQRTLLKLYLKDYESPNKQQIDNEIIDSFAPYLSTFYAVNPVETVDLLVSESKKFDGREKLLAEKIFYKMRWNQVDSCMIASKPRWKKAKKQDTTYSPYEWAYANDKANDWLYENSSDRILLLKNMLDNDVMYSASLDYIKTIFKEVNDKLINKINDAETRRLINIEVDKLMHSHKIYKSKEMDKDASNLIFAELDEIYKVTLPEDLMERYRNVFENEEFPFYDMFDYELDYAEVELKAKDYVKNIVEKLIGKFGKNVLNSLIKRTNDNNYFVWRVLYEFSEEESRFIDKMLDSIKNNAFVNYIDYSNNFNDHVKKLILKIKDMKQRNYILQRLPLRDDIIDFVEKNDLEDVFWERTDRVYGNISEKIYNKMLKYCPINLLPYLLHDNNGPNYDKSMEVLESIIKFCEAQDVDVNNRLWGVDAYHYLGQLIDKLDEKFYTDELVHCELLLLSNYMSGHNHNSYPKGIKEFFWRNPDEFFKVYYELLFANEYVKYMPQNSLAKRLVYKAIFSCGNECFIPVKYMLEKSKEFRKWAATIIDNAKQRERKVLHRFCNMLINIMALCPETDEQKIWPTEPVADVLELVADNWTIEDMREINESYRNFSPNELHRNISKDKYVGSNFSVAKINSIGVRTVDNGAHELAISEKYMLYADKYKATHPVTCESLKYIAISYKRDGENDRQRAVMGNDFF